MCEREILLAYPDFNIIFVIHTNASEVQLGYCISQKRKPIASHKRKLCLAQTGYTDTVRELLSVFETHITKLVIL